MKRTTKPNPRTSALHKNWRRRGLPAEAREAYLALERYQRKARAQIATLRAALALLRRLHGGRQARRGSRRVRTRPAVMPPRLRAQADRLGPGGLEASPMTLTLRPTTLREARRFADAVHSHLDRPQGGIVSVGVEAEGALVCVAILGRANAQKLGNSGGAGACRK